MVSGQSAAVIGSLLLVVVAVSHISTRIPLSSLEQVVYVPSEEEVLVPVGFPGGGSAFDAPRFTMASGPLDSDPSERSLERTEQNRCNGAVHACASWMDLQTGKMRMTAYTDASWCTEDDVKKINKGVCLDPNKKIAKTAVVNVPKEGDTIPSDVWEIMTLSCPFLQPCEKPAGFSKTYNTAAYTGIESVLKSVQEYVVEKHAAGEAEKGKQVMCCLAKQTEDRKARLGSGGVEAGRIERGRLAWQRT